MGSVLIVAAAGMGVRLGRPEPKALVPIYGRPIICWALDMLDPLSFDAVIVAAPADRIADFEALVRGRGKVVAGGPTRSDSVRRAFERAGALPRDIVCIHDAARPLVSANDVASVIAAV
jgi:2-C-methyl-D-erythritol 4-phosphate cytidylyltransferase